MAKGSVRKKGKKWYYRFYVEDASGNRVQKEFPGTESKSETESLLRKAMEDYETKMFLAQAKNITLGDMLDMWVEEELKPGSLSDGTVTAYINTVSRIKKHPIGKRKLKTVTSDHLQSYMDLLSFGGTDPDGKTVEALSKGSLGQYSAVLQNSFRFAVFPKRLITFNPMQYVVKRIKGDEYELFTEDGTGDLPAETPTISHEQYLALNELLKKKHNPALLPIQIAYFAGLRIGEVCGLTWQDIDLKEQCLTIRRSMRYDSVRKKTQIGPTKRKKIRTVDFCDTLAAILREPQYLDLVKDQLTAEQFIQPQEKELYEAMLRCREQGVEISLTALHAFAGEEALNELSHLAAQYSDVNCTPDDIRLYLDRIARGMPVASKAASMTNEELSSYFQSMREKKQGLVCEEE